MDCPETTLEEMIGTPPTQLEAAYRRGRPADPVQLQGEPTTRLLAVGLAPLIATLGQPFISPLAKSRWLRVDKRFDPTTECGADALWGRIRYRFRMCHARSQIDGQPTLLLSYASPADRNHWPVPRMVDELRTIAGGLMIGPTLVVGWKRPVFWYGIQPDPG